jgi:hypothetical protein
MTACPNPFRQALDPSASAPARMNGDPLAAAARLIAGLRPDWQRPERFHEMKAEALDLLRRAAASPCAGCEAAALRDRACRLEALLRNAGAELARHRHLLAAARPKPRRRWAGHDPRQAALPLA